MSPLTSEKSVKPWSELSFVLKPSPLGGVGVFAAHDIAAGTHLFTQPYRVRTLKVKDIPQEFMNYCIYINYEECICPEQFDRMEIGWYVNHSSDPNIVNKTQAKDPRSLDNRNVYAIKDIKAGEEILIDYNYLKEPEHLKEDYYKLS